jgi:hypothetical protein
MYYVVDVGALETVRAVRDEFVDERLPRVAAPLPTRRKGGDQWSRADFACDVALD